LFRKPKNQRVKRALEKREAKIFENDKTAIFVRGGHTSEVVTQFLSELVCSLKCNCSAVYKVVFHCVKHCYAFLHKKSTALYF